jgi:hypothetical protein
MKKIYFLTIALLFVTLAQAQIIIEGSLNGQSLITKLRADYKPNQTLGYDNGRDIMYSIIENDGNNGVHCIYTDFTVYWTQGTDPSSNVYQNGSGINAEHVYPQSMGADNEPARSDMHNLRPSRVSVNADRGNCPFREIPDAQTDRWHRLATSQTATPTANINEWSEKEDNNGCAFEPRESVKGDIARTVFYFYTIYPSANNSFFQGMKNDLIVWHYADPVDATELNRSNAIKTYQGNDNPFVLDSTLARRAFFPQWTVVNTAQMATAPLDVTVFPNPFGDFVRFSSPVEAVRVTDTAGRLVLEQNGAHENIVSLDLSHLPKGNFLIFYEKSGQKGQQVLIKK